MKSNLFVRLLSSRDAHAKPVLVHHNGGSSRYYGITKLAWSPDGGKLVGSTGDNTVRVWRADGAPLAVIEGCGERISAVAWSPDGRTLAAGSSDQLICLWSWEGRG